MIVKAEVLLDIHDDLLNGLENQMQYVATCLRDSIESTKGFKIIILETVEGSKDANQS